MIAEQGLAQDRLSYVVRRQLLHALEPKWNGSVTLIEDALDQTEPYARRAAALKPLMGYVDYVRGDGDEHLLGDDYKEAINDFTKALAHGEHPVYLGRRAYAFEEVGELQRAASDLRHAVRLRPSSVADRVHLGDVLRERGQYDEALTVYERALTISPSHPGALNGRASVRSAHGQHQQAIRDWEAALDWVGERRRIRYSFARTLTFDVGKHAKAAEVLKPVMADAPDWWGYHYTYIMALYRSKDCDVVPAMERFLDYCQSGECPDENRSYVEELLSRFESRGSCA
jgi:tetratricopeptide (TPR) repeat protein